MRKLNSVFKTKFISEAGAQLKNNDYFAFVELDDFACYVIADGITDLTESESARTAVESIILRFQENPSMGKSAVRSYLRAANKELLEARGNEKLKASVSVIVTDYAQMRYASVGNTRFRLYREGVLRARTLDLSLSQDLVDEGELTPNLLTKHEQRHNLYTYLGQEKDFRPYISAKIELMNSDIILLYTRGLWEQLDEAELDDIYSETGDDPQEALDNTEDMLLSKQAQDLGNYTVAAIFADKVFADPNAKRRRRRMIKIVVITLLVLLIVGLICWFLYSRYQDKVDEMNLREENTVACLKENNYIRAHEEAKKGLEKAEDLNEKEKINRLSRYLRLIEAAIAADDAYQGQKYDEAFEAFQTAKECSRYADNLGSQYIERRLKQCEEHLGVMDLLHMGDKLTEKDAFGKAEQRYLEARDKAAGLHDAEGKQQAKDALDKLYDKIKQDKEEKEKKAKQKLSDDLADLVGMGNKLQEGGDYRGAELKYLQARDLAAGNYDADGKKEALAALDKLYADKEKKDLAQEKENAKRAEAYAAAAGLAAEGDAAFAAGDLGGASVYYHTAIEKYAALSDAAQVAALTGKLRETDAKRQALAAKAEEAGGLLAQARELHEQKEFTSARQVCQKARQAYRALNMPDKIEEVDALLAQIDIDAAIMETMPE